MPLVDLSHTVEHGMTTYPGLPGPIICDYLSREASRAHYGPGVEFQIGKIEMVANTGTYLDSPFHRYADGKDLAQLPLESLADLEAVLVRFPSGSGRAITRKAFEGVEIDGSAGRDRLGRSLEDGALPDGASVLDGRRRGLFGEPRSYARGHRFAQHRRHGRCGPAGPFHPARRRGADRGTHV
jgi:Putative cyclase